MKAVMLKDLKPGEWFTLKPVEEPRESAVWVRSDYDRSTKKYDIYKWYDINRYSQRKGTTIVYTDFTF